MKVIGLAQKKKKKKLLVDNFELPGGHRAAPGRAGAWTTGQHPQAERCWRRHRPLLPRTAAHRNVGLAAKELSHLEEFKILLIQRKKLFVSIFCSFFFFFSQEQRGTTLIPKRASSWGWAHRRGPVLGLPPPPSHFGCSSPKVGQFGALGRLPHLSPPVLIKRGHGARLSSGHPRWSHVANCIPGELWGARSRAGSLGGTHGQFWGCCPRLLSAPPPHPNKQSLCQAHVEESIINSHAFEG